MRPVSFTVGKGETLTPAEQIQIGREMREALAGGDTARAEAARNRLVLACWLHARNLAISFNRGPFDQEEMTSNAMIYLLNAAFQYDPDRGLAFTTFAEGWLRSGLFRYIKKYHHLVRVPEYVYSIEIKAKKQEEYEKLSKGERLYVLHARDAWSIPVRDGDDCGDDLFSPNQIVDQRDGVEAISLANEQHLAVRRVIDELCDREREVVTRYFGIDCERETLELISKRIGVTRERARQIREIAIDRIRKRLGEPESETGWAAYKRKDRERSAARIREKRSKALAS